MLPEYSSMEPGSCTLTMSNNEFAEENCPTGNAFSRGRMAAFMQVGMACCAVPGGQSGSERTAALGVDSMNGEVVLCFSASKPAKKKSLFSTMGPPTEPPSGFTRRRDGRAGARKRRASGGSLRKYSNRPPWGGLPPLLVMLLI